MGLLTLYSGLLLPWLGGTLWLVFADAYFNKHTNVNRFRQAGYGFFLGYAVLFLAVMGSNNLTGLVSWPHLMVVLLVFTVSGAIAAKLALRQQDITKGIPSTPPPAIPKALFAFAMVLMTIHLIFIAVEIITQPLYPWDAWAAWVYRAKAWFLSGGITGIASPSTWVTANSADIYTFEAWSYPPFASIIPYWAALSLGRWSETLINLPVLFAGLAMGMGLYGQCREHGLSIICSLIACYLLFSIPMFGTHLALAGYADIWMAGFTGLGFVAVMRGTITYDDTAKPSLNMILGLLMIMFSVWVKNEGAVWFLAALAMLILAVCRPRVPILIIVTIAIAALLAFALGHTYIEIPLIGKLGLVDERLSIPFIGIFNLEVHDVRSVYWENFIKMGSWNLLWVAVAGSLLLGFRSSTLSSGYSIRRTVVSFMLVFLATQIFIFGFTNKGLWADTYTAINRLPLHFIPALLFAVVVTIHARLTKIETTVIARESHDGDS